MVTEVVDSIFCFIPITSLARETASELMSFWPVDNLGLVLKQDVASRHTCVHQNAIQHIKFYIINALYLFTLL